MSEPQCSTSAAPARSADLGTSSFRQTAFQRAVARLTRPRAALPLTAVLLGWTGTNLAVLAPALAQQTAQAQPGVQSQSGAQAPTVQRPTPQQLAAAAAGFPTTQNDIPLVPAGARVPARAGTVQQYVRQTASGFVAIAGEVENPGGYRFETTLTLKELMLRCGGPTAQSTGTLRLIRNGRPTESIYLMPSTLEFRLLPGDVLIAEGAAHRSHGVTAVSHEERANRGAVAGSRVQLVLVGLTERPVWVNVLAEHANVPTMLQINLGQIHIAPREVSVILAGKTLVPGDAAGNLPDGSILIFDPRRVAVDALPELPEANNPEPAAGAPLSSAPQLNLAPLAEPLAALPSDDAALGPAISVGDAHAGTALKPAEPVRIAMRGDGPMMDMPRPVIGSPIGSPYDAGQMLSELPGASSPAGGNASSNEAGASLSELPRVTLLAPPPPQAMRVADASGNSYLETGPTPSNDSHIVQVPAEAFYAAAPPRTAAPPAPGPVPTPIDLADAATESKPTTASEASSVSAETLGWTLAIGTVLGTCTFLGLRKLPLAHLAAAFSARRQSQPEPSASVETSEEIAPVVRPASHTEPTAPAAPMSSVTADPISNQIADLIAGRYAFREESVPLPATLRVHGRSPGLQRLRIDEAGSAMSAPHFAAKAGMKGAMATESTSRESTSRESTSRIRIDRSVHEAAPISDEPSIRDTSADAVEMARPSPVRGPHEMPVHKEQTSGTLRLDDAQAAPPHPHAGAFERALLRAKQAERR